MARISLAARGIAGARCDRKPATDAAVRSALADEGADIFLFLRSTPEVDDALAAELSDFNALLEILNAPRAASARR